MVLFRRGLRKMLRPTFSRLAQILETLSERLEQGDRRLEIAEHRLHHAERRLVHADQRFDGAERRLDESQRLHDVSKWWLDDARRRLDQNDKRLDSAESRLDGNDVQSDLLRRKCEGMAAHLEGLSNEHRQLQHEMQKRIVQLTAYANSLEGLDRGQAELREKFEAVDALHWDHVALARRLALIEDHLSLPTPTEDEANEAGGRNFSIPFPGFADNTRRRAEGV
ncbi:MAG: hypothetical protein NVSMB9_07130 [Isosphaeraceae bacterium]